MRVKGSKHSLYNCVCHIGAETVSLVIERDRVTNEQAIKSARKKSSSCGNRSKSSYRCASDVITGRKARYQNSFFLYRYDVQNFIRYLLPSERNIEVELSKVIGTMWANESCEVKLFYEQFCERQRILIRSIKGLP